MTSSLAVIYLVIGVAGCISWALRTPKFEIIDGILLCILWPLYGPFLLMKPPEPTRPKANEPEMNDVLDGSLIALKRASNSPLAVFLPDLETTTRLNTRLQQAKQRVMDIDKLLAQPLYDETSAETQQASLRQRGDNQSAHLIDQRLLIIRRLKQLRDDVDLEVNQIQELLVQLQLQAEIVHIAGAMDDGTRELVESLLHRIQGLEEFLMEDAAMSLGGL